MVKRHLAGLIVAGVIAGSGATAVAATQSNGTPPAAARRHRAQAATDRVERRMVHGDLIVKGKDGFEHVTVDKGTVERTGDATITLKRPDGPIVTFKVTDSTKFKGVDGLSSVRTGDPALVVSKDGTAVLVGQRAPGRNNPNSGNVGTDEEQVPAT
jgi:hypothetical protein